MQRFFVLKMSASVFLLCVMLISITVFAAKRVPKDFFKTVGSNKSVLSETKEEQYICLNPMPDEQTRKKADRLREILLEDWNEHNYVPSENEMDNVYVYDNRKVCYLTFDDGPSDVTPYVLDVLKQYKAKATFFVTGQQASARSDILKQIYKEGHAIGNHSYSHNYESVYSSADGFRKEILDCKNAINEALGIEYDNLVFRFPGGYSSLTDEGSKAAYSAVLGEIGYKYIDWSCLTGDSNTTEPDADYLMNTLMQGIGNSKTGDIVVLMHDSATKQITADMLPRVIEYIYSCGYRFETLQNK